MNKEFLKRGIGTTFGLAGAGVGMGIIGQEFGSAGLQTAGATTIKFVPMAANIVGAGAVLGLLKGIRK